MSSFSSLSRACAHRGHLQKHTPTRSLLPSSQIQLRRQFTSTPSRPDAQPIDLVSDPITPSSLSSSSGSSTLASTTLSRATTDHNHQPTAQPQPPSATKPRSSQPTNLARVTRTGTMKSTVQLTTTTQTFSKPLRKHYTRPTRLLAHDPFQPGYLREGDVVQYSAFNDAEMAAKEAKRKALEDKLIARGTIRLKTSKGRVLRIEDVGVKMTGPKVVVRSVVTPFGVGLEERGTGDV